MLPYKIAQYKFVPRAIRKAMFQSRSPANSYEQLFQSIAGRAIMDAIGFTGLENPHEHNMAVRQARVWFKFSENVEEIFELGGLVCAKEVRAAVIKATGIYRDI